MRFGIGFSGLVVLFLLFATSMARAGKYDYYECVNDDGAVYFSVGKCPKGKQKVIPSDEAPRTSEKIVVPQGISSPSPTGKTNSPASVQPGILLYATSWCGYCRKVRELFAQRGIKYTEYDIEKTEEGRSQHAKLGGGGVPVLVINGEVIHGYSEERILAALKLR